MKYVLLTEANSEGVSEVFHSVIIPETAAPEGMIDRWNSMAASSPVIGRIFDEKENVAIGSTWNENSQELTLAPGTPEDKVLPSDMLTYAFFVNNAIIAIVQGKKINNEVNPKYIAALSGPVTIIGLEDSNPVGIGYTYNGSTFSEPVYPN